MTSAGPNGVSVSSNTGFSGENVFLQPNNWLPNAAAGVWWIHLNSTFCVMPGSGSGRNVGISGIVKTSLNSGVSIGVAGAVICDNGAKSGFALYGDVQLEAGPGATYAYGMEIAAKNKGSNVTTTPYASPYGSLFGIQLSGGGDNAYGGSAAAPCAAGLILTKNAHTWNYGILFKKDAITGADGATGTGIAIGMALGHLLDWDNNTAHATLGVSGAGANIDMVATLPGTGRLMAPRLNLSNIPTSAAGLASGDVWKNAGVLTIV